MKSTDEINVDVVVIGGGIQGLWVLREFAKLGLERKYTTVLLESEDLVCGQTAHSHAYIHQGHMFADTRRAIFVGTESQRWKRWFDDNNHDTGERVDSYFVYQQSERAVRVTAAWAGARLSIPFHIEQATPIPPVHAKLSSSWKHFYRVPSICLRSPPVAGSLCDGVSDLIRRAIVVDLFVQGSTIRVICKRHQEDSQTITLTAQGVVLAAGNANANLALQLSTDWVDVAQDMFAYMLLVAGPPDVLPDVTGYFFGAGFVVTRKKDNMHYWLISDRLEHPAHARKPGLTVQDWALKLVTGLFEILPLACERRSELRWGLIPTHKTEGWDAEGKIPSVVSVQRHPRGLPAWAILPNLLTLAPAAAAEVAKQVRAAIEPSSPAPVLPPTWRNLQVPTVCAESWETFEYITWELLCVEFPALRSVRC